MIYTIDHSRFGLRSIRFQSPQKPIGTRRTAWQHRDGFDGTLSTAWQHRWCRWRV